MRGRKVLALVTFLAAVLPPGAARAAPPANDDFADAAEIGALPARFIIDTTEATDEILEPDPSCASMGASVWFRLTAADDLMLAVSTYDSDFDTVLAVWRGDTPDELREVHCNDRRYSDQHAGLSVGVHEGETMHIQAGGYAFMDLDPIASRGRLVLEVSALDGPVLFRPPVNDDIAAASPITSLPFRDYQETDSATLEPGEPACPDDPTVLPATGTVWYSYAPPEDTPVFVRASGMYQDLYLAAYERRDGSLVPLRCKFSVINVSIRLGFVLEARAGTTYLIQVGTFNSHTDGFAYGTSVDVTPAVHADVAVRDLTVAPVEYETDAGRVPDPTARDISFVPVLVEGEYWGGSWRVEACPGPAPYTAGECTLIRSGYSEDGIRKKVRWNSVAAGTVTIVVTLASDYYFDPDPSNNVARAQTTIGPVSEVGVVAR